MKIRKIEFEDHPILGTIDFDFCDEQGDVVDTIIIAGENGVGKSVLLNEIYFTMANIGYRDLNTSQQYKAIYTVEVNNKEKQVYEDLLECKINKIVQFNFDYTKEFGWTQLSFIYSKNTNFFMSAIEVDMKQNEFALLSHLFEPNTSIKNAVFSDVEINFTPEIINATKTSILDDNTVKSERSNNKIATEIAQLLIDIDTQDNNELGKWVRDNPSIPPPEDIVGKRIKRFSNAFSFIFPLKQFYEINNDNKTKQVLFKEDDKLIPIENLSTGEKQIVFRGSFLLRNQKKHIGSIILIDEPEISLHPEWQKKILDYFKKLFTDENGVQTSQLIVVTHSPFIIHNPNRANDKVIIMKKDEAGKVVIAESPKFYGWSGEEAVKEAFNIDLFNNQTKPVVYLEGETDEKYFNKAIEVFDIKTEVEFRWIGQNTTGGASFTGDSALNKTATLLKVRPELVTNKIALLYDSDTNRQEESHGNLLIRIMPKPQTNVVYTKGIESLLNLPEGFNYEEYYSKVEKTNSYGAKSYIADLDKSKLCEYICSNLNKEQQKNVLSSIKEYIERLISEMQ